MATSSKSIMNTRVIASFKDAHVTYSYVALTDSPFPYAITEDRGSSRITHELPTRSAAQAMFLNLYRSHADEVRGYDETL